MLLKGTDKAISLQNSNLGNPLPYLYDTANRNKENLITFSLIFNIRNYN